MIEMVFFDAGETLLKPRPSFAGRTALELGLRGHSVDETAVVDAWREAAHAFTRRSSGSHDREASRRFWTSLYVQVLELLGIDDPGGPQHLYEVFSDPATYELYGDVRPCLDSLAGMRLGIISNFEAWLDQVLERLGVRRRFEVVAISGPLGIEKPDLGIFQWAAERAGLDFDRCAHVGDQVFFDAAPACAAGMRPVLLDRYDRFDDDPRWPRIASLSQLSAALAL